MEPTTTNPQFTCISCAIAFHTADDQREHYRSDHHRYNMKRRVAGLPPLSAQSFNQKVIERRAETALTATSRGMTCELCRKEYITENAYKSHLSSKKHRDRDLAAATARPSTEAPAETKKEVPAPAPPAPRTAEVDGQETSGPSKQGEDAPMDLATRLAASRSRLPPTTCLFCTAQSSTVDVNLAHMKRQHGLFIPDAEYLTDLPGLLTYLGEKVAVGHACLWCQRQMQSLEAIRQHMHDKSHCKIAYDAMNDRLEISDYYDFTASYQGVPPPTSQRTGPPKSLANGKRPAARKAEEESEEDDEWEDDEEVDEDEVDEVVEADSSEEEVDINESQLSYGDTPYELVLPSGARIGHRSLRRYYVQKFNDPLMPAASYSNSQTAVIKRLIKDTTPIIPASGGDFGGAGRGMMVIKAKTRGQAKEAGRHIREHRDTRWKQEFKTKVGFRHNSQKHFRDQLLQ